MLLSDTTVSLLQVVTDADDWSKQDGLLLLFLLCRLCTSLPAVSVFPVQSRQQDVDCSLSNITGKKNV